MVLRYHLALSTLLIATTIVQAANTSLASTPLNTYTAAMFEAIIGGNNFVAEDYIGRADLNARYQFPGDANDGEDNVNTTLANIAKLRRVLGDKGLRVLNPYLFRAAEQTTFDAQMLETSRFWLGSLANNSLTMLMVAALKGHTDIIQLLVNKGADIDALSKTGHTALMLAAAVGNLEIATKLIKSNASIRGCPFPVCTTALAKAAWQGDVIKIKLLVNRNKAGVDDPIPYFEPNSTVALGDRNILWEATYDFPELRFDESANYSVYRPKMKALFQPPIVWAIQGYTPLLLAVANGKIEAARTLLDLGADVNLGSLEAPDVGPLFYAVMNGNFDIVKLLLNRSADVTRREPEDLWTPLFCAAHGGNLRIVNALLKSMSDAEAVDVDLQTPSRYAASAEIAQVLNAPKWFAAVANNDLATISKFLAMNSNFLNFPNPSGKTACQLAAQFNFMEIVSFLSNRGALACATDWFAAVATNDIDTIKSLLDAGYDVNTINEAGENACQLAARFTTGADQLMKLLVSFGANCSVTTSWFSAVASGNLETVISLARSYPGLVSTKNAAGLTACQVANDEIAEFLSGLTNGCPKVLKWFGAIASGDKDRVSQLFQQDSTLLSAVNSANMTGCEVAMAQPDGGAMADFLMSLGATCPLEAKWFLAVSMGNIAAMGSIYRQQQSILYAKNVAGETACQIAAKRPNGTAVVEYLDQLGGSGCSYSTRWFLALANGDVVALQQIAQQEPDIVNVKNSAGETACQLAVKFTNGAGLIMKTLISLGANCTVDNSWFSAVAAGDLQAVISLARSNPEVLSAKNSAGLLACEIANDEIAAYLAGVAKCPTNRKWFAAIATGDANMVERLYQQDPTVLTAVNEAKMTGCDVAMSQPAAGDRIATLLMGLGANCSLETKWFIAVSSNDLDNIRSIYRQQTSVINAKNGAGETACQVAAKYSSGSSIVMLLNTLGPATTCDLSGYWFETVASGNFTEIRRLARANPSIVNNRNAKGQTACEVVAAFNTNVTIAIFQMMVQLGADCPLEQRFFAAIATGNVEDLKSMLLLNATLVNEETSMGETCCDVAMRLPNETVVALLIAYGAECNPDVQWFTAIATGDTGRVRDLLRRFPRLIEALNGNDETACQVASRSTSGVEIVKILNGVQGAETCSISENWFEAVAADDLNEVRRIQMANKAIIDTTNAAGLTACQMASQQGSYAIVHYLISLGAQCSDSSRWFSAVAIGNTTEMLRLWQTGANKLNETNHDGETACQLAAKDSLYGDNVISLLLSLGDSSCSLARSLMAAIASNNMAGVIDAIRSEPTLSTTANEEACNVAYRLLDSRDMVAKLRSAGFGCKVPLVTWFSAVAAGNTPLVSRLLDEGVDVNATNSVGETACDVAIKRINSDDLVKLLLSRGASCPLDQLWFAAAANGDLAKIQQLVLGGFDTSMRNPDNVTGCHVALERGNTNIYEFLRSAARTTCPLLTPELEYFQNAVTGNNQRMNSFLTINSNWDVNIRNSAGKTACQLTTSDSVRELLIARAAKCCQAPSPKPVIANFNYIGVGYNIFFGNPEPASRGDSSTIDPGYMQLVFDLTCDYRDAPGGQFRIPTNTDFRTAVTCDGSMTSKTVTTSQELHESLSVSMEASGKFGGVGASASFSYKQQSEMLMKQSKQIIRSETKCTTHSLSLNTYSLPNLSKNFNTGVRSLPLGSCDGKDDKAYFKSRPEFLEFIETFGTHYVSSAIFGAKLLISREISDYAMSTMKSMGISVSAEAGADGLARVKVGTEYNRKEKNAVTEATESVSYVSIGSKPSADTNGTIKWAMQDFDKTAMPVKVWLDYLPELLTSNNFKDVANIATRKKCLEKVMSGYCQDLVDQRKLDSCTALLSEKRKTQFVKKYKMVLTTLTWDAARAGCESSEQHPDYKWELAVIKSEADMQAASKVLADAPAIDGHPAVWVGFYFTNRYQWTYPSEPTFQYPAYTPWAPGEPNGSGYCGALWKRKEGWLYDDVNCQDRRYALCSSRARE